MLKKRWRSFVSFGRAFERVSKLVSNAYRKSIKFIQIIRSGKLPRKRFFSFWINFLNDFSIEQSSWQSKSLKSSWRSSVFLVLNNSATLPLSFINLSAGNEWQKSNKSILIVWINDYGKSYDRILEQITLRCFEWIIWREKTSWSYFWSCDMTSRCGSFIIQTIDQKN